MGQDQYSVSLGDKQRNTIRGKGNETKEWANLSTPKMLTKVCPDILDRGDIEKKI